MSAKRENLDALSHKIENAVEIGAFLRKQRKVSGITQADAAALCNVGVRFFSELENGKPTLEIDKVFSVLKSFGIECFLHKK